MSRSIAKELDNTKQGDRGACPLCNPKKDRVSHSKLWAFVLRTGEKPFKK